MRPHDDQLDALGVRVAVVTFESGPPVDAYVRDTSLRWPILLDRSLDLYRAYGMGHGHWWDVWGPPAWWVYLKLLIRGRRLQLPSADVNQLGGDVLIDPAGIVQVHHVGKGPADRPTIGSLLAVIRRPAGISETDFTLKAGQ